MAITLIEIIVAIVVSAVTGAIASLVAPWANWGVEKRKNKLLWRKGFINECKRIIGKNDFDLDIFRESSFYSNLKSHLSDKLKKEIKEKRKRYILGKRLALNEELEIVEQETKIKNNLFDEIAILEKSGVCFNLFFSKMLPNNCKIINQAL